MFGAFGGQWAAVYVAAVVVLRDHGGQPLELITMVPAAPLASITHSPRRKPPGRLRVHPFGSAGHECTFQVETTGTFQPPWQPPQQTHPVPNWSAATATGAA